MCQGKRVKSFFFQLGLYLALEVCGHKVCASEFLPGFLFYTVRYMNTASFFLSLLHPRRPKMKIDVCVRKKRKSFCLTDNE